MCAIFSEDKIQSVCCEIRRSTVKTQLRECEENGKKMTETEDRSTLQKYAQLFNETELIVRRVPSRK